MVIYAFKTGEFIRVVGWFWRVNAKGMDPARRLGIVGQAIDRSGVEMELVEFVLLAILELLGAGFGVYFGIGRASAKERKIRKEEENKVKRRVVDSLLLEVNINKQFLEKSYEHLDMGEGRSIPATINYLADACFEGIKNSGSLSLLSINTQMNVSLHYGGVKRFNDLVRSLELQRNNPKVIHITVSNIEEIHKGLLDSLSDVVSTLQSEMGERALEYG